MKKRTVAPLVIGLTFTVAGHEVLVERAAAGNPPGQQTSGEPGRPGPATGGQCSADGDSDCFIVLTEFDPEIPFEATGDAGYQVCNYVEPTDGSSAFVCVTLGGSEP